jgi:hypothetical protein
LLPRADRTTETTRRAARRTWSSRRADPLAWRTRPHVVADPLADVDPTTRAAIDWDATLAIAITCGRTAWRRRGVDLAQRRMGLDWTASQEVIQR